MAKPVSDGRRVPAGRNPSIGAAVLDRPVTDAREGQTKNLLQEEILRLVEASRAGRLDERGRVEQFEGQDRRMVEGVNAMLDAILLPIGEGNRVLAQISTGKIDELITQTYAGDHEKMKQAVNSVAVALQNMAKDVSLLTKAAVEGKLATRADASKHQGDYRKIVEGVNQTLDAVIGPLNVSAEYVDRISKGDIPPKITDNYNGDFNEIKNNLNNCIDNITALVTETGVLIKASAEGRLATRADATKHQGDYRKIVEGVNEMLDAILLPIGEGNRILGLVRGGNLREKVEIACKGDHEKMKQAVNGVHDWLTDLVAYVTKIANGDMSASMAKASGQDQIHEWLVLLKNNINALVADAALLARSAADGQCRDPGRRHEAPG